MFFKKQTPVSTNETKIDELLTRGVENVIPKELGLEKLTSGKQLRIYLGIDPTGAKLHLGHSVPLRKLKAFADLGHHVIFLVGSFTAMIGDPTGRDTKREMLTREQVEQNFKDYKRQASKILDFSKVELRYNDEWLAKMGYPEIMRLASYFTVQQMLERDMFQERLKRGEELSPNEFMYPLMQGYDSVMLDVDCEIGGNDQLFNMLAGRKLQKAFGKREKFVLTTRLIEGTDGRKMSKTYGNCIYLEDAPNEMFGKVMTVKDELMLTYFETLTDFSPERITEILASHPKEAKMALAEELVRMYHGESAAQKAKSDFTAAFSEGGVPSDVQEIHATPGVLIVDELIQAKVVDSKSEWRRLVDAGAVKNADTGEKISDATVTVEKTIILKVGKHRFVKIKIL